MRQYCPVIVRTMHWQVSSWSRNRNCLCKQARWSFCRRPWTGPVSSRFWWAPLSSPTLVHPTGLRRSTLAGSWDRLSLWIHDSWIVWWGFHLLRICSPKHHFSYSVQVIDLRIRCEEITWCLEGSTGWSRCGSLSLDRTTDRTAAPDHLCLVCICWYEECKDPRWGCQETRSRSHRDSIPRKITEREQEQPRWYNW